MHRRPIIVVAGPVICRLAVFASWIFASVASAQDDAPQSTVPVAARQAEIRKLIDDTFEVSKANTPAKKQAVAQKLMEMVVDPATTRDELYVSLQMVLVLQRDTGDFPS